jgi:hypothetical protein
MNSVGLGCDDAEIAMCRVRVAKVACASTQKVFQAAWQLKCRSAY